LNEKFQFFSVTYLTPLSRPGGWR